jgi:ribosomal protein S18 acetylase RimI-like enzyme
MTVEQHDSEEQALPRRPSIDGSDIRKLTYDDVPRIARALARSFEDDPVMSWVFPQDTKRLDRLEVAFGFYLRKIWLRRDECYAVDRLFGAALWLPPGEWHLGPIEQLRLLPQMIAINGRNLPRMVTVLRMIETSHPKEPPHYYLAVLGVEPELQGRGFGSALMQPVLRRCDRERVPAYLESSKRRNVVLYERHGFRVVEELKLPKGGPPMWRMWREPAS